VSRPLALIAAGLVAAAGILFVLLREDEPPPKQAAEDAPNVIVIMTDDQALNSWNREVMPRTFERFSEGTRFEEAFAVPPLCCPARASLMTGRYPHNHGVLTNNYNSLDDKEDVLPVWLSDAGYETMIAGKFLNGYERAPGTNKGNDPAPGWDRWWVAVGEERRYFDYDVSIDGEITSYGSEREDYVTNALTDASVDFMVEEARGDAPYFLWMAHPAPHFAKRETTKFCPDRKGPIPLPSDFRDAAGIELPTPPNFFEEDVSDKPLFISDLVPRTPFQVRTIRKTYRCTVASLAAVDRSVETVFETLEETGELEDTLVFFISDNGEFFGEHRKREGKKLAYDAGARVPFALVLPGVQDAPAVSSAQTGTIDIAPTILELAGLEGEHLMDGRSLTGALGGKGPGWPRDRGLVLEIGQPKKCVGYRALRTPSFLYTEYREFEDDGCGISATELYDTQSDPFLLENKLGVEDIDAADATIATELAERLAEVNTCSGIKGRDPGTSDPFCE